MAQFKDAQECINFLLEEGYIALNFCDSESSEVEEIEHYELLEPGQEISDSCYNLGRIPLTSNLGKGLIERYLKKDGVVLHPDIK